MLKGCSKDRPSNTRGLVAAAEEAKVDSLWVPDHFVGLAHPVLWADMALAALSPDADAWYDPFACIAVIGHESNRPMGVCVTDAIRRRAPDVVRTALTLHQLCRGGFTLGIGAGEAEHLVPFGYDFSTPVADLEEFLTELVALLKHGVMPSGSSGRIGLPLRREDLGPPKVWVAAHLPRMLRLTGEYGDGWVPAWPMSPASYGQRRRVIAEHADRAGRPMPECALHAVMLGQSRDHVADLMERDPLGKLTALFCSAEIWAKYGMQHPAGDKCRGLVDLIQHDLDPAELRELAPTIPFELVEELFFIGNATEIADRVGGYADNGLEHAILGNATGTVGGLDEINANARELTALVAALGELR